MKRLCGSKWNEKSHGGEVEVQSSKTSPKHARQDGDDNRTEEGWKTACNVKHKQKVLGTLDVFISTIREVSEEKEQGVLLQMV